ncbi:MAG: hypothetical protein HC769_22445 [Cyanobacteria bacterium CRU_2_1]|nr:hypothetical protein [Cyanobacteria bacterium CRU_2_1]
MSFLVLLETSGNQNFIFSTNKLRENVGASELTYRAGTTWVFRVVDRLNYPQQSEPQPNRQYLRQDLLNRSFNPPIEPPHLAIEIIYAASGKALLLAKDEATAKAIVQQITQTALIEAPGLEICGIFKAFDWETDVLGDINRDLHRQFEQVRAEKPSAAMRFLRLPVVAECETSGLPANEIHYADGDSLQLSCVSIAKRNIKPNRLKSLAPAGYTFAEDLSQIDSDWLAIIHADGNGLGQIFLKFHEHIQASIAENNPTKAAKNRHYVDTLRRFSIALDICTENAFATALADFPKTGTVIPLIPLILGGDDLTVVCDGRASLQFTKRFLQAFERETGRLDLPDVGSVIPDVAKEALKAARLSACAGVSIIKPHFPFSVAYDLAEKLLKSAKTVKHKVTFPDDNHQPYPCSAMDFHILYDSSGVDLKQIREKLKFSESGSEDVSIYHRHNRPYVVTDLSDLASANGVDWSKHHHWEGLETQVRALQVKDENDAERRKLPNSQLHNLRSGLFLSRAVADSRFRLVRDRYRIADSEQLDICVFEGEAGSLFQPEPDSTIYTTGLLDAIDVSEFLQLP